MITVDIDLETQVATVGAPSILVGVPGPQGQKGDKGDKGDQGNTGNTGPQGPKGDPGDLTPADSSPWAGGNISLGSWVPPVTKVRTLTANVTITSLPANPVATVSGTVTLVIKQASSGGPYSVAWPATAEWPNDAAAPAMPATANAELIVHMFWTGQAWRCIPTGVFYP